MCELGDWCQSHVGQPCSREIQGFEPGQLRDPCQSRVGDAAVGQHEFFECGQVRESTDGVITDGQAGEVEHLDGLGISESCEVGFDERWVEFQASGMVTASGKENLDLRDRL